MRRNTTLALIALLLGCTVGIWLIARHHDQTQTQDSVTLDYGDEKSLDEILLDHVWLGLNDKDRGLMCEGWQYDKELMLMTFMENLDDPTTDPAVVRGFFEGKCG